MGRLSTSTRRELVAAASRRYSDANRKRRVADLIDVRDRMRVTRYAASLSRSPVLEDRQFHGSRS